MMDREATVKKIYLQAKMMSWGMSAAVFVYGAMGYFLIRMGKGGPAILDSQSLQWINYGGLLFSAAGIFLMRQLRERILKAAPAAGAAPSSEVPRSPQKLFAATILLCAAAEMPVLLGLVLVFLSRSFYIFLPFAGLSLCGFFFAFPKKPQWEEWLGTTF